MKRVGHLYEQLSDWDNLLEAERVSVKHKKKRRYVQNHLYNRIRNLTEIQHSIEDGSIHTGEYKMDEKVSGQGKLRQIGKLNFHPSHIWHQDLVIVANKRVEKRLIYDTYASRIGKGQTAAALRVKEWLKELKDEDELWYAQGDICKYYNNIPHDVLRREFEGIIKDKRFVNAIMEPFDKFAERGIPLGARPSQMAGNMVLEKMDRFIKETLRVKYYLRYLDDFVIFGKTKGEVKRNIFKIREFVESMTFKMHEPKIRRIDDGLDIMGYVFYRGGKMYWRKSDKVAWLKRRAKVTNPKRLRELDSAAKGMLKWGSEDCKKLYKKMTGISLVRMNLRRKELTDEDGNRIIEAAPITSSMLMNKRFEVIDWVEHIKTSHGTDRMALKIKFYDNFFKWIVNAQPIKRLIEAFDKAGVTRFVTVLKDSGNNHFDFDDNQTVILEINHRTVEDNNGEMIYSDNKEKVTLKDKDDE